MNFSVQPTLFIGIGSTGVNILDRLRKYVYEEFGEAGLPCFRYLALETDAGTKLDDGFIPREPQDYEKIKMLYITVPQLDVIKSRLTPGGENYLPGLDEWLDENLLDGSYTGFSAGAANRRHAGRLCLWENWAKSVKPALKEAYDSIRAVAAQSKTVSFLQDTYLPKRLGNFNPNDVDQNLVVDVPRVFITGTLCGGTGSGIFIDLAFYILHRLLGGRAGANDYAQQPQVIGMFTIPSPITLHDGSSKVYVVNTWTALKELDFYSRGFDVNLTMPDGDRLASDDVPFDLVYLAGMQNVNTKSFGNDFGALSDMCALALFTEMVPAIASAKGAARIDFRAANAGYMQENDKKCIRAFSSFGLAAIWYPRYRIAKAITYALGQDVAQFWLGAPDNNLKKVEEDVDADWTKMLTDSKGRFMGTVHDDQGGANIPEALTRLFEERQGEFVSLDEPSLRDFILAFPSPDTTLTDMFSNPDGDYFRQIALTKPKAVSTMRDGVTARVSEFLATHTLVQTKHYLERLVIEADNTIQRLPESLTTFAPLSADGDLLAFAQQVFHDLPTTLLARRAKAREEYKKHVWDTLHDLALAHAEGIRDYFLREVLRYVVEHIRRLRDQVRLAEIQLNTLNQACATRRKEHVEYPKSVNVFPISREHPERLDDDVEIALAAIRSKLVPDDLKRLFIGQKTPLDLLNSDPLVLLEQVERVFDSEAQAQAVKFQIGSGALEQFKGRLPAIVGASAPYVPTVNTWQSMATNLGHSPNMLFCHEAVAGRDLATAASKHMPSSRALEYKESPLDHFVIFYREEPGLAISDLAICDGAMRILNEYETKSLRDKKVTSYTHKMGEKYFSTTLARELAEAQHLAGLATLVAPDLLPGSNGQHYLEYEEKGFKQSFELTDDKSLRMFLNDRGFDSFKQLIHKKLQGLGVNTFRDRANQAVSKMPLGRARTEKEQALKKLSDVLFSQA